jgi:oxygen-dependent protoporphyrinogen oxidase
VVADPQLRTTACGFLSTKFPGRAPEGHVLLRAFLGSARDPGVLDLSDERLVETALADLGPVLELTGRPILARVFRWPAGTPQMEVGHVERVSALDRSLAAVPGLAVTGAGLRGTGIPDTIADARRAAAALVDAAAGNNVPSGTYSEVDGRAGGDRDSQR